MAVGNVPESVRLAKYKASTSGKSKKAFTFQKEEIDAGQQSNSVRLIEDILLIGPNIEDLKQTIQKNNGLATGIKSDPIILLGSAGDRNFKELEGLGSFVFPFGYKAYVIEEENPQNIITRYTLGLSKFYPPK